MATSDVSDPNFDEQTRADSLALIDMMQKITGHPPQIWNVGTLGFDTYGYKYESGREGTGHAAAFYPRKGKITIYLMDGTTRHADALAKLGTHSTSRICLYIKRLSDTNLSVLEDIVRDSYRYLKDHDGHMHRV